MRPPVPYHLHVGSTGRTSCQGEPWQGGELRERPWEAVCGGGAGDCLGLWGRNLAFFPTHCLTCLPLSSATSWAANRMPVPEEPHRAALFRRKCHQRIKNISTRGDLDRHPHEGPRTKEGLWPSVFPFLSVPASLPQVWCPLLLQKATPTHG